MPMPKLSDELKGQIKQAARHPVTWWRGADLPEENLRPWEGGIQFLPETLKGFMHGFVTIRNRIYTGMAEPIIFILFIRRKQNEKH